MDKVYNHKEVEEKWSQFWEKNGYFKPEVNPSGKPFSIILPPPNANADLHLGHAMYTIEDILIRYHRMIGDKTLWLPGADHAGFETQVVFEKKLQKEDKSRFDFDRETLYCAIWDFVQKNKSNMEKQLRHLGFSLDWTRGKFTLDPEIVKLVYETFFRLYQDKLLYRGERIVNFCTHCGTAFSDLEIKYVERKDPLYYIKYGPFVLATTRLETKFGDTAVCFHPGDKRYEKYLGKEIEVYGVNGPFKVRVIADSVIDPKFGTGIEKVTPGHDVLDFEIGQRHNLPIKKVINPNGRLNELTGRFCGLKVLEARKAVYEAMKGMGLIDHVDEDYTHSVATCYKCNWIIEPLVMPQWFIKVKPLAKKAIEAVVEKKIKIIPSYFEKTYFNWLKNIRDWNISRQIVWGIRIPVWYCVNCNKLHITFLPKDGKYQTGDFRNLNKIYSFSEIKAGLQVLRAEKEAKFVLSVNQPAKCEFCDNNQFLQETDVFDTWFSSSQWALATLKTSLVKTDFQTFYPTSVMETGYDILFFWVARMIMMGIYLTGKIPFKAVYLHGLVRDLSHQKMSKSKGNVIDPSLMVEKYSTDALRAALVFGTSAGTDLSINEDKIRSMRNFGNKIWNAARFVLIRENTFQVSPHASRGVPFTWKVKHYDDKWILEEMKKTIKEVNLDMEKYRFGQALEKIYEFFWHQFCDIYIEKVKNRKEEAMPVLLFVLSTSLSLLHPFMPFITEELWSKIPKKTEIPLIISPWPKS